MYDYIPPIKLQNSVRIEAGGPSLFGIPTMTTVCQVHVSVPISICGTYGCTYLGMYICMRNGCTPCRCRSRLLVSALGPLLSVGMRCDAMP